MLALVVATAASYGVGWAVGAPPLVPVFNTLASYPFMVLALKRGDVRLAVARMLLWALTMAVCATTLAYWRPWQAGQVFANGANYRQEMFTWVMTGRGPESSPAQFLPAHLRDLAVFVVAALVSGGLGAMAMGAALMNFMGTYVGSLAAASRHPVATVFLAWHPWSVIRIVSFVTIGVVLAVPLVSRVLHCREDLNERARLLTWATAGLVADVVLKTLLAPAWQRLLARVVGW
jgi:hypothetical protein